MNGAYSTRRNAAASADPSIPTAAALPQLPSAPPAAAGPGAASLLTLVATAAAVASGAGNASENGSSRWLETCLPSKPQNQDLSGSSTSLRCSGVVVGVVWLAAVAYQSCMAEGAVAVSFRLDSSGRTDLMQACCGCSAAQTAAATRTCRGRPLSTRAPRAWPARGVTQLEPPLMTYPGWTDGWVDGWMDGWVDGCVWMEDLC